MKQATDVQLTRVDLSIGSFDMIRFSNFDHAFPRHTHDHYTVGVFETSAGSLQYRGTKWGAERGAILVVPPDEVHAASPDRAGGWTYRALYPSAAVVRLACEGFRPSPAAVFEQPIVHDGPLARSILELHWRLGHHETSLDVEETLLLTLRRLVGRHASERSVRREHNPAGKAVTLARDYIEARFNEPIRLAHLAETCEMSPFHLLRSFRDRFGLPPHAYLTQVRAARAREMLGSGESITTVAYRCGFADQSHLTRVFRAIYGVTPGVYGREARRALAR